MATTVITHAPLNVSTDAPWTMKSLEKEIVSLIRSGNEDVLENILTSVNIELIMKVYKRALDRKNMTIVSFFTRFYSMHPLPEYEGSEGSVGSLGPEGDVGAVGSLGSGANVGGTKRPSETQLDESDVKKMCV